MIDDLTEYQIGYLSGMIDADGSIIVQRTKGDNFFIRVMFYNNSFEIIEYIQSLIGKAHTSIYISDRFGKIQYQLSVKGSVKRLLLFKLKLIFKEKKRIIAVDMLDAQFCKATMRYSFLLDSWEREIGHPLKLRS